MIGQRCMARSELLPRLPTPSIPIVIRSLGGKCPLRPSAEAGTIQGVSRPPPCRPETGVAKRVPRGAAMDDS